MTEANLDLKMKKFRNANDYYELHQTTVDLEQRFNKLVSKITAELQTDINISLRELNKKVCEPVTLSA